tara:strand:+ start:1088 stop:1810 length:723 start_codon:yes stop_codon:yes gene_type:complete
MIYLNILFIIVLILFFIFFLHKRSQKKGPNLLNKVYNKKFNFNSSFNSNHYNFINNIIVDLRSNLNILNIFKKFDIKNTDSFLDIGSGDGFNLLYMNKFYKFKNIIGVELDKNIFETSINNISLINNDKIQIYNKDALEYIIPPNITYIYLYNPFTSSPIWPSKIYNEEFNKYTRLIDNIKKSYIFKNRQITIIFSNITPLGDSEKKILELFKNNFKIKELIKINSNPIRYTNIGIFNMY